MKEECLAYQQAESICNIPSTFTVLEIILLGKTGICQHWRKTMSKESRAAGNHEWANPVCRFSFLIGNDWVVSLQPGEHWVSMGLSPESNWYWQGREERHLSWEFNPYVWLLLFPGLWILHIFTIKPGKNSFTFVFIAMWHDTFLVFSLLYSFLIRK